MTERLVNICSRCLSDEDLYLLVYLEACELCDSAGTLTDDLCVERTVDKHSLSDLVCLLVIEEVAASSDKLCFYIVIDRLIGNDRLLGRADHTVVKGL